MRTLPTRGMAWHDMASYDIPEPSGVNWSIRALPCSICVSTSQHLQAGQVIFIRWSAIIFRPSTVQEMLGKTYFEFICTHFLFLWNFSEFALEQIFEPFCICWILSSEVRANRWWMMLVLCRLGVATILNYTWWNDLCSKRVCKVVLWCSVRSMKHVGNWLCHEARPECSPDLKCRISWKRHDRTRFSARVYVFFELNLRCLKFLTYII